MAITKDAAQCKPNMEFITKVTSAVQALISCLSAFNLQGLNWWWTTILSGKDDRPHMIIITQCTNLLIENIHLLDSPQFHLLLKVSAVYELSKRN